MCFLTSLRWSSYVTPKSSKGGLKTRNGWFPSKIALCLKKVCYKVSLCNNCERQSCMVFIGLTIRAKMTGGGDPCYLKFWVKVTVLSEIADFRSIFARSASAVQPSEKVQLTLIGHRTLSLSPQRVDQKCKVSKIWTISCNNSETARDRTGFRK